MTAPFVRNLCGYRKGKANTSDASDAASVELGAALFEVLGVPATKAAPPAIGNDLANAVLQDLKAAGTPTGVHWRKDGRLPEFSQFAHLAAVPQLRRRTTKALDSGITRFESYLQKRPNLKPPERAAVDRHIAKLRAQVEADHLAKIALLDALGEESLLRVDIVGWDPDPINPIPLPELRVGLSLKWSLRTDRAQDCISQGAKMSSNRRGVMPHYATVTMEPRPYFLAILGQGSGAIDAVYHLALPELDLALAGLSSNSPKRYLRAYESFQRLRDQGRLRDYSQLSERLSRM